MTVATDALVSIPDFLNGISKYVTWPTGCPVIAGFDLDHVAQEKFLPLTAQAALAVSVETRSTVGDVEFCTRATRSHDCDHKGDKLKGHLKIIGIRQGYEPYLNMVMRNAGSDETDDNDGGCDDDSNDDDNDGDNVEKFPTHKY